MSLSRPKYRLECHKSTADGQWYVRAVKRNNKIAWVTEGYKTHSSALKAANTLLKDLVEGSAVVVDVKPDKKA